ncbi:MAG: Ig-like domain-containing protein [Sulfurovum sp.]|nr:Ig-like domain-containing protein [Sulfurovum sp.]
MKHYLPTFIITLFLLLGCGDIAINAPIVAPEASDDTASLISGNSVEIMVLSNDSASTGKTLNVSTVSIVDDVSEGATVVNDSGSISYTSDGVFIGTETFTYQVEDSKGTVSNIATVTITIQTSSSLNIIPTASNDTATTTSGTKVNIIVLSNDSDSDGTLDSSSVAIVTDSANGVAVVNTTGTIDYTPNGSFIGTDTFSYQVKDDEGSASNVATVTITVS